MVHPGGLDAEENPLMKVSQRRSGGCWCGFSTTCLFWVAPLLPLDSGLFLKTDFIEIAAPSRSSPPSNAW
jgi:hypothetical protein